MIISQAIDTTLDRKYNATAGRMLAQIKFISNAPNSQMQKSLAKLDKEAKRLVEDEERMQPDNAQLEQTLNEYQRTFETTQSLILANDDAIQKTGQAVAIPAVTAKVFQGVSAKLSAPLSASAMKIYTENAAKSGIVWNVPDALDFAGDYVNSPAWIKRMEGWGVGYADIMRDNVLKGLAQGWSPNYTAAQIRQSAQGLPRSAAENITRTLQLTSYRDASAAMEEMNGQFIEGKIRVAHLDDRTCFPPDTNIVCLGKDKKITDVKVGDLVLTHTGKYQRVVDVMERDYSGDMVKIIGEFGDMECTSDHYILILREGYYRWVMAKSVNSGDVVFIAGDNGSYNLNHVSSDIAVKWSVWNSNNNVPVFIKSSDFSFIGGGAFGMPVNSINLNSKIERFDIKIDSVPINFSLLLKRYLDALKAEPEIFLWFCFACVLVIATWGAKFFTLSILAWTSPIFFAAVFAFVYKYGASAFFGAKVAGVTARTVKKFSASLAYDTFSFQVGSFTLNGTVIIPTGTRRRYSKVFSTSNTSFVASMLGFAFSSAIIKLFSFFNLAWAKLKTFAASFTCKLLSISFLPNSSTRSRATRFSALASNLRSQNSKTFSTNSAGKVGFVAHIVLSSSFSNPNYTAKVYNLEVENDNTYTANGVVVHNCLSCISLHGTPLKAGERVDDHFRGRCDVFYQVAGGAKYPELMQADSTVGNRQFVPYQSGEDWFNSLSPERQAAQASFKANPAKLRAFRDGVPLSDFVGEYQDEVFGKMTVENSLIKALEGDAAQYYEVNKDE